MKIHLALKKILTVTACGLLLASPASAYPASKSYSINSWGEKVTEPSPYVPTALADGLGLKEPKDMCVQGQRVYIADSGNNRVLVLSRDFHIEMEISAFILDGKEEFLLNPQGVYATAEGNLYVADTDNGRILEFASDGSCTRAIGRPQTPLLDASFAYKPSKLAVDSAGRIYITAIGVNLGLIQLTKEGGFQTFMGAIQVTVHYADFIWKRFFSTQEQMNRMTLDVPTEYSNIFLDDNEFVFGTVSSLSEDDIKGGAPLVRRLNPTGVDVLRRLGVTPVIGEPDASSRFCDITATSFGAYFALDQVNGSVYVYDSDGNYVFNFGQLGNRFGNLQSPAAICQLEDGQQLLVLDTSLNGVLVYESTDYGASTMTALSQAYSGNMEQSYQAWEDVLKLNANNEFAYVGIGRYYLKQNDYPTAMYYFKMANNKTYYDKAFNLQRKLLMQKYFGPLVTVLLAAAVLAVLFSLYRTLRKKVVDYTCQR